jgi:hypothetical protein
MKIDGGLPVLPEVAVGCNSKKKVDEDECADRDVYSQAE